MKIKYFLIALMVLLAGGDAWAYCYPKTVKGECVWECTDPVGDDVAGVPNCKESEADLGAKKPRPSWVSPFAEDCATPQNRSRMWKVKCFDGVPCGYTCRGMALCGDYNQDNACFK